MKAIIWRLVAALVGLRAAAALAAWVDRRVVAAVQYRRATCGGGCHVRVCAPMATADMGANAALAALAAHMQGPAQDEAVARAALRAQGHSELIGDGDSGVVSMTTNPVPLHPRPIVGEEIRVTPPVPMTDLTAFQLHMALSRPEYEKRRFRRRGKWKVS